MNGKELTELATPRGEVLSKSGGCAINIIGFAKGSEHYVFLCDESSRNETLKAICRCTLNDDLNITGADAWLLSQRIMRLYEQDKTTLPDKIGPWDFQRKRYVSW